MLIDFIFSARLSLISYMQILCTIHERITWDAHFMRKLFQCLRGVTFIIQWTSCAVVPVVAKQLEIRILSGWVNIAFKSIGAELWQMYTKLFILSYIFFRLRETRMLGGLIIVSNSVFSCCCFGFEVTVHLLLIWGIDFVTLGVVLVPFSN